VSGKDHPVYRLLLQGISMTDHDEKGAVMRVFAVLSVFAAIAFLLFVSVPAKALMVQQSDDATRKLWDTAFINQAKTRRAVRTKPGLQRYRVATPGVPIANVAPDTVIGVTLWRLRRAGAAEGGERLIVHEGADTSQWLPERISAQTKLAQGDRLRISVEAARKGYLYVIDREQYADGTLGEPYLIFPTTRTQNGDNQVSIGKLTEIPAQEDNPPYFTVRRSRADHVAEVLSVLVTPAPLAKIEITDKAQKLDEAQVAAWEKSWSTGVGWLEMEKAGQAWTREERQAVNNTTRSLLANSPSPQMVYYRPSAKTSEPLFVKLHLWYKSASKRNTKP